MSHKRVIPSSQQLQAAYDDLTLASMAKRELPLSAWVQYSRYARFDSRLAELWVFSAEKNWTRILPVPLREENLSIPDPAIMAVLLEHVELLMKDKNLLEPFRLWKELVTWKIPLGQNEQFFIGLHGFSPAQAMKIAEKTLKLYQKWGYFGDEVLINKFKQRQENSPRTYLDLPARKMALKELMEKRSSFTVDDYIEECGGNISRRSAQLDLQQAPGLKRVGRTRAQIYKTI
jgi:hypothetical protein